MAGLGDLFGVGGVNVGEAATSAMSVGTTVIIWGLVLCLIMGVMFLIYWFTKFKHHFTHVEVVNDRKIILFDKARDYKDKDGVIWWKTLKTNELCPLPPPEAIEIDKKGKKCVRAYRTPSKDFVYSIDSATVKTEPPKTILSITDPIERYDAREKWFQNNPVIAAFQPLTSNHRNLLVSQIKKAKTRTTVNFWQQLAQVAMPASMVIMLLILVLGWEKVMEPALQANGQLIAIQEAEVEKLNLLKDIKNNVQTIKDAPSRGPTEKPPD